NMAASIASVSIGGRVFTKNGRGISRAVVSLTELNGNVRYAFTNPSGYYHFNNVKVSETYNLEVKHKQYSFAPQVLFVDGQLSNLNFTENNKSEN
ncbi:MAG TPA: carboxypeptidase-like regulatory domain-containing protein, partial [Pyrinomonadaceae bacterium]|nr:carboxypeptidase-like regulatory domain-containing protein [Pyrinomonadaceae bacterium]